MNLARHATIATLLAVTLVATACGGSSTSDDPASPTTTTQSQSSTSNAPATTTTKATTTSSGTDTTIGGEGVELQIGAIDNEGFTKDKLFAPAGVPITVQFNNGDTGSGEQHNWRLIVVSDVEEYATELKDAPDKQEITFTIGAPGEYLYTCDTHLEAMKGVLVVEG